jgi:hypothetical protein
MIDEDHYLIAQKNVLERQTFLDGVDMEKYSSHVEGIFYDPKRELPHIMGTRHKTVFFPIGGVPAKIYVYPDAFRYTPEEFYNCLLIHEGTHARQAHQNPRNYWGWLFDTMNFQKEGNFRELEAYSSQITHPSFMDCRECFQIDTALNLLKYSGELAKLGVSQEEIEKHYDPEIIFRILPPAQLS